MVSPKVLGKMMLLITCSMETTIKDSLIMRINQTILNKEMLNKIAIALNREIHLQDPDNHLVQDTEVEMTLETVEEKDLTMTIVGHHVKIKEILILILSLKSTSLELFEILDRRILQIISASLERSKTSL